MLDVVVHADLKFMEGGMWELLEEVCCGQQALKSARVSKIGY